MKVMVVIGEYPVEGKRTAPASCAQMRVIGKGPLLLRALTCPAVSLKSLSLARMRHHSATFRASEVFLFTGNLLTFGNPNSVS